MNVKHLTSQSLSRLLSLTEKKEKLIQSVSEIEDEIAKVLHQVATTAVEVAESVTPFKPKAKPGKRTSKGELKERILALLEAAGDEGLRVKDIAKTLGTKTSSVSVWFSTTGKDITTKISNGLYSRKAATSSEGGKSEQSEKPQKKTRKSPSKRGEGKPADSPKAPRKSKKHQSNPFE